MNRKKIVFLTGTRADFGKLKSLISITQKSKSYEVHLFATGMHMNSLYGATIDEIRKNGFDNIYPFINHDTIDNMDRTLSKTIDGFSHFIAEIKPDLIVVHGDRVEAMAGAIVGSLNNIVVAHIEGGEVSGTIDELIRHAVSKMSHIHLVANKRAETRLIQLGELPSSIFVLGSPDLDLMNPEKLPNLLDVKKYYNIEFDKFSIAMFHPVTTEFKSIQKDAKEFVDALIDSNENYVVIYPNNDLGSHEILNEYKRLEGNSCIKIFPSLRFEYFLVLLKNSNYMIGNSSAGIREAPYYGTPTVDIGSRQNNRSQGKSIFHADNRSKSILKSIGIAKSFKKNSINKSCNFGHGNSDQLFLKLLNSDKIWGLNCQKQFQDIDYG
ncbi:MAG: UDP-N-acetylglucosamine 2-epimerase (hydrolyzing) [Gammaproteobacteria bacterium]|nr:UDP-N-acetylglucosamine 2-epimerase (hydrolyzing) [Gammaproteobacteria bacterium]